MKLNYSPVRSIHNKSRIVLCVDALHMVTKSRGLGEFLRARLVCAKSAEGFARIDGEEPGCWPFVVGVFRIIARHRDGA